MVGTLEARKFNLSLSSPKATSFLFEPNSQSLALMHCDSSFSLFPSFSPFSFPSSNIYLPSPQTLISPPSSTSACFVQLINPNPKIQDCPDEKKVAFVTAGPHNGGSRVVLRFNVLGKDGKFDIISHVGCTQNGVSFDRKLGVIVDVSHGMKVMVTGDVNYLALHSASGGKVWVFGVKLMGDGKGLRLVKCAVIECRLPVSSICLSFGFLFLGESGGVRVFPLRALAKGRVGSSRRRVRVSKVKGEVVSSEEREVSVKVEGRNSKMPNGVIRPSDGIHEVDKNIGYMSSSKMLANGHVHSFLDVSSSSSIVDGIVKQKSLKFQQDSGEWGMQFVVFNDCNNDGKSEVKRYMTTKAISIRAISKQKFLILDSNGDLHVLHVSKSGAFRMRKLTCSIQVQRLAALPDTSSDSQTLWISDGLYSVHVMAIPSSDTTEKENDGSSIEGEIIQSSVTQAIFTSENIQNMMPLAANKVLILGQDSLYAYAIS